MPGKPPDTPSRPDVDPDVRSDGAEVPAPRARFCLAVLVNARNEILLLRRSRTDTFAPGLWGLPGGHIAGEETPDQTMLRELNEEIGTGVSLRPLRRFGPVRDTLYGGIYEVHLFLFRYAGGPIRRNTEHEAEAWVGKELFRTYAVVDGIDEDLHYLDVWPAEWLNAGKLGKELSEVRNQMSDTPGDP